MVPLSFMVPLQVCLFGGYVLSVEKCFLCGRFMDFLGVGVGVGCIMIEGEVGC